MGNYFRLRSETYVDCSVLHFPEQSQESSQTIFAEWLACFPRKSDDTQDGSVSSLENFSQRFYPSKHEVSEIKLNGYTYIESTRAHVNASIFLRSE